MNPIHTTHAEAKRLMMQHLSLEIIREEGSTHDGHKLWDSLYTLYMRMAWAFSFRKSTNILRPQL